MLQNTWPNIQELKLAGPKVPEGLRRPQWPSMVTARVSVLCRPHHHRSGGVSSQKGNEKVAITLSLTQVCHYSEDQLPDVFLLQSCCVSFRMPTERASPTIQRPNFFKGATKKAWPFKIQLPMHFSKHGSAKTHEFSHALLLSRSKSPITKKYDPWPNLLT